MMSAPTSTQKNHDSEKDRIYDEAIDVLAKCQPFTSKNAKGDKNIAFLLHFPSEMDISSESTSQVIRKEWGCEECVKRVKKMFYIVDSNGAGLLEPDADDVVLTEEQQEMVAEVRKFVHERMRERPEVKNEKWRLEVVGSVDAWQKTMDKLDEKYTEDVARDYRKKIKSTINIQSKMKGGYEHYYVKPIEVSSDGTDLLLMNKAFHKYQRLLSNLFEKFRGKGDWKGMVDSIEIMLKILKGATYGHKFVASTTWFIECFKRSPKPFSYMSVIERANFIGKAICTAPIGNELGNQAAIPFYHQVNDNIMGLLGTAQTETSMRRMVEMRLNPNYYQQKTAAPKAGAVAMAAKALGQFSISVATVNELETDPRFSATIKIGKDYVSTPEGETDIYAGLRTKGQTCSKPKGAAGFASRVGPKENELPTFVRMGDDRKHTMTVCELMKYVKNGDIHSVKVLYNRDFDDAMITSTTLPQDRFIHPHTWIYLNNGSQRFTTYTTINVTHMVPIQAQTHTNCIFVLEGGREALRRRPYTANACLGELLNSKYHACKSTFMEVGRKIGTKVPPPSEGELAFGFGLSKATTYGSRLSRSVDIYINDINKPITVRDWI
jgi:hypothetical protein